jgi:uncharacterized membrane protein (GlpM family)
MAYLPMRAIGSWIFGDGIAYDCSLGLAIVSWLVLRLYLLSQWFKTQMSFKQTVIFKKVRTNGL